jgi:uncharacterized protein YceK
MNWKTIIVLLVLVPFVNGCASAMSRAYRQESHDIPRYYPGVWLDGMTISTPFRHDENSGVPVRVGFACLALVDLPFSVVFDTILLPVDKWAYEPRVSEIQHRPGPYR